MAGRYRQDEDDCIGVPTGAASAFPHPRRGAGPMDASAVLRTFAAMASAAASPVPRAARRRCEELRRHLEADSGGDVQVRETHVSWVLLTDAHAYKLKKPVRFGFVDQSTVDL